MSNEKMREDFENWAVFQRKGPKPFELPYFVFAKNPDGSYVSQGANDAWEAWQASRAAVVVDFLSCHPQHASYNNVDCYAINDVRVILKRHGLEMKS